MKKKTLFLAALLAVLLICTLPVVSHANDLLVDAEGEDTSVSYVEGRVYVPGDVGTSAGYNPEKTVYSDGKKVNHGNPKTAAVQGCINEAYNTVKYLYGQLENQGIIESFTMSTSSTEILYEETVNRVVSYICKVVNEQTVFENTDDPSDRKTADELISAYSLSQYVQSSIRNMPVGDGIQIRIIDYCRVTRYVVEASCVLSSSGGSSGGDSSGSIGGGSSDSSSEIEKVAFNKLKKVKLKALSAKKLQISWKKLSKKDQKMIQKIQIDYSTDKTFQTDVKTKWAKKSKASYTIKGLKKNTKYWVRIRAYKKDGNTIYVSSWVIKNKKTKKK